MLAAVGTNDSAGRASTTAVTDNFGTVFAKLAVITEVSLAAGTVTADTAVDAYFFRCTVGTLFTAFLADHVDAVGAALTAAYTDIIHAEFADAAVFAEVVFTAHTFPAGAAFGTKLLRRTVGAFFTAVLADHLSTLVASVSAGTQNLHAFAAFSALGTVFAAGTVETALALTAELIVSAVFAFLAASHTDYRAFRASIAAVTDLVDAVFTISAFGTVVALTADAVKAYSALDTQLFLGTVCTLFAALGANIRALRASVATGTDIFHAHFAEPAIGTIIPLAAAACKAYLTVAAQLIVRAVFTLLAAFRTDYGTFRAALSASDADVIHAKFAKITVQTVVAVSAHTVIADSTVLANTAVGAVFTFFTARFAYQYTFGASPAAVTEIFRAVLAKQTLGAVVALAADAIKADTAVSAQLFFCTDHALLITFTAAAGTI